MSVTSERPSPKAFHRGTPGPSARQAPQFLRGGPFLSESQVAELLGVSHDMVRKQRLAGAIGHQRIGRRVVYSQAHIEAFLRDTEQGPTTNHPLEFRRERS
jgi:hypothetical protein